MAIKTLSRSAVKWLFLLFFINALCLAQEANTGFGQGIASPASFGKPFWADMHSTLIRAEIAYATNSLDYDWSGINTAYRPYIFTNLGADIPIWSSNFSDKKFGFILLHNFQRGWYKVFETEAQTDVVERSRIPFELYIQYQYQSTLFLRGFQGIASAEYRLRERYKYPYSYSGTISDDTYKESNLANCFNFFAGMRYDNQKSDYFSKIGMGVRYYIGINPYGQFRSMPYYSQLGFAFIFE